LYIDIAIDNTAKGIKMPNPWLNKIEFGKNYLTRERREKRREREYLRKGREEK